MPDLTLRAGALRLDLRPDWGGRVVRFGHQDAGDILVPVTAPRFDPADWPRAGAYPLVPFHNRVEDACFLMGGRLIRLPVHPATAPHALHGVGSRVAWRVQAHTDRAALLRLDWDAGDAWPWSFQAWQGFWLSRAGLRIALRLRNCAATPMPAGLGWHPFFVRPDRITDDAVTGWRTDAELLPTGPSVPRQDVTGDTQYLADWSRVSLALPGGLHLTLHQPHGLRHLVLHAPPGPYACIEPVSHRPNALRLPGLPDMGPLMPGHSIRAGVRLDVAGGSSGQRQAKDMP